MGVHDLWNILGDLPERKPLKYLTGKRIAVDLSGWVVQAIQCKGLQYSKNPHLRNLFFRVSRLLQEGVLPIFVMEGDLPALKKEAFKDRNQLHTKKKSAGENISRYYFDQILLKCQELLKSLGVPCIKSSGEAEALCAYLCLNKIVDGVITEDNDAFLYGADSVYRDFTIDRMDAHVNLYCLNSKKNKLQLNRKKLIALALLLGCDYCKGVPGVGKESIFKLLSELPDCDLLQRFNDWKEKSHSELFPGYDSNAKKSAHCSRCNHLGSLSKHKANGCEICNSQITCYLSDEKNPCMCSWHKSYEISMKKKTELKIYNASKNISNFPDKEVIDEYLYYKDVIPEEDALEWKCPNIHEFQEKAFKYWGWTVQKSCEKCLPIITSWHQHKEINIKTIDKSCLFLEPDKILKETTNEGEDCLKVLWKKLDDCLFEHEEICTTERLDRFSKAYPKVTEEYYKLLKERKSKLPSKSKERTAPSENSYKLTDYFSYDIKATSETSLQNVDQLKIDSTSKRNIEDDIHVIECCTKKLCTSHD